nr:B3 DNA binding domain-containing protein [Tanacetum cinerariifolium]
MRGPPSKCISPSCFFKFIKTALNSQLSIPISCQKYLVSRRKNKTAILKRRCRIWHVKMDNDWVFGEGWETFVRDNGVQDFDFVVFKHQGNMVFDTMVFDTSSCEREYPIHEAMTMKTKKTRLEDIPFGKCKTDIDVLKKTPKVKDTYIKKSTKSLKSKKTMIPDHNKYPYFIGTLKAPACKLLIPKKFASANRLSSGEMILKYAEKEGTWTVKMEKLQKCYYIRRGLHEFHITNGLENGDIIKFKLIQNDEKPVAVISRLSEETRKKENRCFKSIVTAFSIKKSFVYVPLDFARSNGYVNMNNTEMVVMDEKQRPWPTKVCPSQDRVRIRGFRVILAANGLKAGDEFELELVDNGKKPLMNLKCMKKAPLKPLQFEILFDHGLICLFQAFSRVMTEPTGLILGMFLRTKRAEEEYWGSYLCERCVEISERLRQRNESMEEIGYLENRLLAVEAVAYYREILAQETDNLERFRTLKTESYTRLSRKRIHVRSKLHYFPLIKYRLNEARRTLFHTTCFGPWFDITYVENNDVVNDVFLRMVDNLDACNSFPWGGHIWRQLYDAIINVSSKHKLEHLDGLRKIRNYVPSNSFTGFLFAFKSVGETKCQKSSQEQCHGREKLNLTRGLYGDYLNKRSAARTAKKYNEEFHLVLRTREKGRYVALIDRVRDLDGICESLLTLPKEVESLRGRIFKLETIIQVITLKRDGVQKEEKLKKFVQRKELLQDTSKDEPNNKDDTSPEKDDISRMAEEAEQKVEFEIRRLYKQREARLNKIAKERKYVDVTRSLYMGLSTILNVPSMEQLANQKNVLNPYMTEKCKALKPWIEDLKRPFNRIDKILLSHDLEEFLNKSVVGRSKYKISFRHADDVPKQGGVFGDCDVFLCMFLYRLAYGVPLAVDDPDTAKVPPPDIRTLAGFKNRPPMLNKENYVLWSSRLLQYAKSRPKGKLIHNSIINGPYVRRMISEPGDPNRKVPVNETFHVQTDDELTKKELKQIEADDQAIQTIILGLPEDIYAAVDSCETAQEIWLHVQQMMKGSDIGIQEKNAKLFNEWERIHHRSTHGQTRQFQLLKVVMKQQLKDNDIYSTVDACPNACEMWKAIERLKQDESINVQDLETNLYWEFGKFTSWDGESLKSYYSRFYKMTNELVRNQCDVTNHQVNVQFLLQLQPKWQRFLTLVKQSQELKNVSYHKLYDILKQHQNEVNEIKAERLARTANPLALVAQQQPVFS